MSVQPTTFGDTVVVGIGEMGGVFARAFLRAGHTVHPATRDMDMATVAARVPDPLIALVTVAEADLDAVLADLPEAWRSRAGLVQNELLPRNWQRHGLVEPTVAVVWFEKKPGRDVNVLIPTPVAGPAADLVVGSLGSIGIAARSVATPGDLLLELVAKNVYILTANIAGLDTRGTVRQMWDEHRDLAEAVAGEVLDIQDWLVGDAVDRDAAIAGMVDAIDADPGHGTTGRSAPARLARALRHAAQAGIEVPVLSDIAARHDVEPQST